MESTQVAGTIERSSSSEHHVRIYEERYHQKEIIVLELDHQNSRLQKGSQALKFPKDYASQLRENIKDNGYAFAPEYCVPDLYRYSAGLAYVNQPMISFISRLAGATGRKQLAADPANNIAFGFMELGVSNTKFMFQEAFRNFPDNKVGPDIPLTGLYGKIEDREITRSNTNDSRHLLPARAYMQDILRENVKGVYHFTTPVHAERVDNYVKRQIGWEHSSTIKVGDPNDFKYASPISEKDKMNIWYKGPVIDRRLREYSPTLPKEAYQIDLFYHHDKGQIFKMDSPEVVLSKLSELKQKIDEYLENEPKNDSDKKYRDHIKLASKIIGVCQNKKWLGKLVQDKLSPLIDTNRIGWKLTRKDYIY